MNSVGGSKEGVRNVLVGTRDYGDKASVRSNSPRSYGWKTPKTSEDKEYRRNYIKEPGENYYDDYER